MTAAGVDIGRTDKADRVPHLLHVFPTFAVGGTQRRFVALANALDGRFVHTVISLDGRTDASRLVAESTPLSLVPVHVDKRRPAANLLRFRRILRQLRPDLLITYNWGAIEWALVNRLRPIAPHLHVEDGFGSEEAERQLLRRVLFRRWVLASAERVVVPSSTLRELALSVWKLPAGRVAVIGNGIDCTKFARAREERQFPAPVSGRPVVGTVTALRSEKNIGRLFEAIAEVRRNGQDAVLLVAGEGPERSHLEALARAMGLESHVQFFGYVERPEHVLGWFDVFALSSDTEQAPISVIEAMAAGLPVAATAVGDIPQMVAPENRRYIVPPDSGQALGRAIAALLGDDAARARIGAANAVRAGRHYALDAMIGAYGDLWGDLTQRGP